MPEKPGTASGVGGSLKKNPRCGLSQVSLIYSVGHARLCGPVAGVCGPCLLDRLGRIWPVRAFRAFGLRAVALACRGLPVDNGGKRLVRWLLDPLAGRCAAGRGSLAAAAGLACRCCLPVRWPCPVRWLLVCWPGAVLAAGGLSLRLRAGVGRACGCGGPMAGAMCRLRSGPRLGRVALLGAGAMFCGCGLVLRLLGRCAGSVRCAGLCRGPCACRAGAGVFPFGSFAPASGSGRRWARIFLASAPKTGGLGVSPVAVAPRGSLR